MLDRHRVANEHGSRDRPLLALPLWTSPDVSVPEIIIALQNPRNPECTPLGSPLASQHKSHLGFAPNLTRNLSLTISDPVPPIELEYRETSTEGVTPATPLCGIATPIFAWPFISPDSPPYVSSRGKGGRFGRLPSSSINHCSTWLMCGCRFHARKSNVAVNTTTLIATHPPGFLTMSSAR